MEYLELPDDTSYLHLLKHRNTLWEINKETQVYEVEIVHENDEYLDKNFDDILNMNQVYCSICNLNIPKIYLKQHNKSSIHQSWIKLMEEVFERTKKHLKTNIELNNSSLNVTDTFFCDICSRIIQNKNRNEHFESKFHKKKVIFEKLLNFFVEAYLRDNEEDVQFNWEDLNDCMDRKNELDPLNESDPSNELNLPENISKDPSQIQSPLESVSKDPSDITDSTINVLDPDYLEKLLESIINKPSAKCKTLEKRNLPNSESSVKLSKMDRTTGLDPVFKDAKSEHSDNQLNLNTINPNFHNVNPNLNTVNPNLKTMNLNFHHVNPNFNNMNPNLNPMNPNFNPINPNFNPMNPNFNPMNPNFNPMNPNFNPMNPNFNPMNPNFNPMNPNFNPMNPNFNPMNPNFNPMNPHLNPNFHHLHPMPANCNNVNPSFNPINPNSNPHFNTNKPNLSITNPNFNPMNPNFNPINPNFHNMNPNVNPMNPNFNSMNPMDARYKMNSNLNTIAPNINFMNPNSHPMDPRYKLGPNLNTMEPQPKLGPNLIKIDPQSKLGPNLTMDPQFKLGSNLITIDPLTESGPNLITMDPQSKLGPNLIKIDPQSKLGPNSITMDPQSKLGPNLITMNPQFELGSNLITTDPQSKLGPNLITMDPQSKLDSNLITIDPQTKLGPNLITMDPQSKLDSNLITIDPQTKLGPNLITMDPQSKLGPNLITIDPQTKSDPNLITMDPQSKSGPNLITMDPQSKLDLNSTDPAPKLDPNSHLVNSETKKLIKSMAKAERKREKQMKNLQAFKEFSVYIRTIQDKYPNPDFKIEAVSVSKIKVTALNGDCVLVTRVNFQSYNKNYCRVCQNGNLGKDHEMSEEHISKIMVPVADKNCIREIDDIWNHCIICNELIKFVEDHNKMATHLANLKRWFVDIPKPKQETERKDIEELFNRNIISEDEEEIQLSEQEFKIPDKDENRNTVDVEKRVNTQEQKEEKRVDSQEKKVPYKFDMDKFSNTLADKLLPLFAKYALTKVDAMESNVNKENGKPLLSQTQNINSVQVSKAKDNINKIKQLKDDIQNVLDNNDISVSDELKKIDDVASNASSTSRNTTNYCSICKLCVTDFETHKTSESHTEINNRVRELKKTINKNNLKEIKDSVDLLKCDMCEVNVNYKSEHIDEHVNSQNHRRNYFKFVESNKIILIDQVESQCEPCNKSLHRSNIFDHCKQDKHVKKLKDFINITNKTQKDSKSKQSTENKTDQKDIDVTKMLYQFRAQGDEHICKICHALVAKDAASIKAHVETKHHIEKYNTLLQSNKIYKTTGSFYCKVCDAKIPMTGEITHVYGRNHSDNLVLKARNKMAKDEPNEATAPRAAVSPVAGPSAVPIANTSKQVSISIGTINIPLYIKYQFKTVSETASTCIICGQQMPNAEVINHAHSSTHNFNFNLIMINNTIKIKGKMYYCVSCNTSVPIFGEIQHIFGKLHLNNNNKKKQQPIASKGTGMLTYDHVLGLTQGKRMVKF